MAHKRAAPWRRLLLLLLVGAPRSLSQTPPSTSTIDILGYVDPLIGTLNGGHVFPGASLPFSMAKAGPDTDSGDAQGGYTSDDSASMMFSFSLSLSFSFTVCCPAHYTVQ